MREELGVELKGEASFGMGFIRGGEEPSISSLIHLRSVGALAAIFQMQTQE
jgi:hypothetical protein